MRVWYIEKGDLRMAVPIADIHRLTIPELRRLLKVAAATEDWPEQRARLVYALAEARDALKRQPGTKPQQDRLQKMRVIIQETN